MCRGVSRGQTIGGEVGGADFADKTLAHQGVETAGGTAQEFAETIAAENKKWGDVIKAAGIKLE